MGGVAFRAPVLSTLFLIVALATLAMPGSANFAGEFLILLGVFNTKLVIAIIASTGVAMASVYMLRRSSARCTTASARASSRSTSACATALVLVPLVLVILAFARLSAAGARALRGERSSASSAPPAPTAVAQEEARREGEPGPRSTGWRSRRCVALVGGACLVLMAGLLRAPFVRHTLVPLLALVALGAAAGLVDRDLGRQRQRRSPARW